MIADAGAPPPGDPGGGEAPGKGGKTPKDRGDKDGKDPPKTPGRSSKKVPGSFVEVIDCLVDLVLRYEGPYQSASDEGGSLLTGQLSLHLPLVRSHTCLRCLSCVALSISLQVGERPCAAYQCCPRPRWHSCYTCS